MTIDLDEAKRRAMRWIEPSPGDVVTREKAVSEEHLALDVVALIAEVERLTNERDEAIANRDGLRLLVSDMAAWFRIADDVEVELTERLAARENLVRVAEAIKEQP